jgi:hypothetical protein
MAPITVSTRVTLATALVIFVLAALWLTAVPDALRPAAYVSVAALLTALAAITMKTYMNGQATSSLAALIRTTDIAAATGGAPVISDRFYAPRIG